MNTAGQPCDGCGAQVRTHGRSGPAFNVDRSRGTFHSCYQERKMTAATTATDDTVDPFGPPEVPRDRFGRPLIKDELLAGKAVAYTRCTTFVGCLEDTYNLAKWQQRMVALGLAARPDLLMSVSAHSDDKNRLNSICDEAREAAAASAAATTGTALHRLAERLDRGEDVTVPDAAKADLDAYRTATAGVTWTAIETLLVHDELKVAGTPDRIGHEDGTRARIWDIKTGSLDFGLGKIAMQLALYAHSRAYDPITGARTSLDVDLDTAVVIHLPAGSGTCRLVDVDIRAGWEAVQLAVAVRAWRARRDLATPHTVMAGIDPERTAGSPWDVDKAIDQADNPSALRAVWMAASHDGLWTDAHTVRAAARKAQLAGRRVAQPHLCHTPAPNPAQESRTA